MITEETVLYSVVQAELETFLAAANARERPLPRFVEREMRGFLECGVLAHGFLRVHCAACGHDRLVAFSCAHLVDRVIPEAPVRQWVITLPCALRYRLAYDSDLTSAVLREFARAVFASHSRRARRGRSIPRAQGGAVTFIQRFGDAINLNLHFHTRVLDGVDERYGRPGMRFLVLPPPDDAEVRCVVLRVARRVGRLLERRGLGTGAEPSEADPLGTTPRLLAGLAEASLRGQAADGRPLARRGDRVDPEHLSDPAAPRRSAD